METEIIKKPFKLMGAGVETSNNPIDYGYSIDVKEGVFQISKGKYTDVMVVDSVPAEKHLLLMVKEDKGGKHKFLMGHDERDWFVAAIPEKYTWVKNVDDAMQALKPWEVIRAETGLPAPHKKRRKNKPRVRQGEWFFIPAENMAVDMKEVIRNEGITRGNGSKPHMVDEVYRCGGQRIYVSNMHPRGISEQDYKRIIDKHPHKRGWFRMMIRNAEVYARGNVRHHDHATIYLDGWHRVLMNTEAEAISRRNLAFLD